jgi:hypothetical protein
VALLFTEKRLLRALRAFIPSPIHAIGVAFTALRPADFVAPEAQVDKLHVVVTRRRRHLSGGNVTAAMENPYRQLRRAFQPIPTSDQTLPRVVVTSQTAGRARIGEWFQEKCDRTSRSSQS